ncbi:MAG TPA: APC family permease [bacterium]|nr:APC family permease [bacterium]
MVEERLKKHLRLPAVFAFGIGPMLSSGIFLLPGMVYSKVGPAAILAYLVAGLLIVPSLLSKAELATAMPRAGGTYYFLDRSMGPMIGTIAGLGTWLALTFKSAFDLIGLGAYLVLFLALPVKPVALALCVAFGVLSITGVKNVGRLQGVLVASLLGFLTFFIARGLFAADATQFQPFFTKGTSSFLGAIGFVYVGFTGLTKVASVAEEVDNPDRILPLGMLVALGVTIVVYLLGMIVIISVLPADSLAQTLTPIADAAGNFMGEFGVIIMSIAALLAFSASANAGLTSASRYPLAMSRDNLIAEYFKRLGRFHTPTRSIILTTGFMAVLILILSPEGIAKLASAFQIMIFGLINLAVIVMRESKIASYDPGFRSVLYPWLQIIGILTAVVLIPELGILPVISSGAVVLFAVLWYIYYAQKRVRRGGAMFQVFQRLGQSASPQLDQELRQILREKGLRK